MNNAKISFYYIKEVVLLFIFIIVLLHSSCTPNIAEIPKFYTVTFFEDGFFPCPVPNEYQAEKGSKIIEPESMTKVDYIFKGWYTDYNFNNKWNFDKNKVVENITLYAKWIYDTSEISGTWIKSEEDFLQIDFETAGFYLLTPAPGVSFKGYILNISNENDKIGVYVEYYSTDGGITWNWGFGTLHFDIIDENSILLSTGRPALEEPENPGDGNVIRRINDYRGHHNALYQLKDIKPNTEYSFRVSGKSVWYLISLFSNGIQVGSKDEICIDKNGNSILLCQAPIDNNFGSDTWGSWANSFITEDDTESIMLFLRASNTNAQIGRMELYECGLDDIDNISVRGPSIYPDPYFLNQLSGWYYQWAGQQYLECIPGDRGFLVNKNNFINTLQEWGPYIREDK